jgi:sugar O-acyltransferase (sialic acid O-acetyltransferase NeuD family)
MRRLGIIGSGDLGQLIAYHARQDKQYEIAGFFDDFKPKDAIVNGIKVLGGLNNVQEAFSLDKFDVLMIGIGYKHFEHRKFWFEKLHKQIPFAIFIHSSSYVDASCIIKEGVFILPGCILDSNVIISENVLINTGVIIAHDSKIGRHSFLSPSVAIAGFVSVGENCNIGINTTIIDNITITNNVQTGGGTVVIKDLEQSGLHVGNPSRLIR